MADWPGSIAAGAGSRIEGDLSALELADTRVLSVPPENFNAEEVAIELQNLRNDAEWIRLELPERAPKYGEMPNGLHRALQEALARAGRASLYTHQVAAIEAALAGNHVVQATSAGSGKSLGFVLPVLDRLLRQPSATALLVFPLRALANDQLNSLRNWGREEAPWVNRSSFDLNLGKDCPSIRVARYDGSTIESERPEARRSGRLFITTPDMLHVTMLRNARSETMRFSWSRVFQGLTYVVLDELHAYQGVFGSNVAQVIRRLRRVANYYGAAPRFLAASATIGNPTQLAERLTGAGPFTLVGEDGSPSRRTIVLVCNPPLSSRPLSAAQGLAATSVQSRIAPQTVAIELVTRSSLASIEHDAVRTICFCGSRNTVFSLSQRIRSALNEVHRSDLQSAVAPYAATFLAEDREEAEGKLRDGSTLAIVSTRALELGIDIPQLSLAILVGYPGQISSFRQQIGRVGRRGEGLAVLIVGDDPLQQYLARSPDSLMKLLGGPAKEVVVSPDAPMIARRYGLGPAQEEFGGIAYEDEQFLGPLVQEWLAGVTGAPSCTDHGVPYWRVPFDGDPYEGVRNAVAGKTYMVYAVNGREREPIGTIDEASAPRDAFVPAIWTGAEGKLYEVTGFDPRRGEIYCNGPLEMGFQTRGLPVDLVQIQSDHRPRLPVGPAVIGYGELEITRFVRSYREQHFSGVEQTLQVQQSWPPMQFVTDGLFLLLQPPPSAGQDWEETVHALEHLLLSAGPAVVACDPYDLEAASTRQAIFLYDSFGGGLRLGEPIYDHFQQVLDLAHELAATCECSSGCPRCVMLSRRPDGNQGLNKSGAIRLLESLLP